MVALGSAGFRGLSLTNWLLVGLTATAYLLAGVGLLVLGGWDIYADAILQGDPFWTTLLENVATLSVGVAVVGAGAWTARRPSALQLRALARWTGIAVAFVILVSAIVVGSQALQSNWKPWIIYANFLGALLLAGFATGLYASRLQYKAYYDALTGLPNRFGLVEALAAAMKRAHRAGRPLAVLHIGIDNFKDVNEGLGQAAGDQLLRIIARRLGETLSPGQTLARLPGDEFVLLSEQGGDRDAVASLAERVKRRFHEPVHLDRQTVRNQATIGITMYPEDGRDGEELLRQSDSALRQGKRGGGNQWVFYRAELIQEAANRVVVGGRLRQAIDAGEIQVAYQPIVALSDEAVIGYEALARWYHPQQGWISPGEFIPVAEQNGLIEDLARIVLQDACRVIAGQGDPRSLFIAVNVSPLQIHRPDIVDTLRGECDGAGIPPEQLVVEITEQAVLDLDATTLNRLQAIREAGISVAIDDFGTGYASLSYLKHLPADRIKVDRQFVSDVDRDEGNQAILNATLTLAGAFGMMLTAEGVETRAEADALRAMGYTSAQGFFFGKPRVPETSPGSG